jgi:hypothetical protein
MTEPRTVVAADPALGFSYQVVLDKQAQRTLVFQTHVPFDASQEAVDGLLDKIGKSADRQIAIYELREATKAIADHQRNLHEILKQRELLDATAQEEYEQSGRKGEWTPHKLTPQQRQARLAVEQQLSKWQDGLTRWQADLDRLKPMVNGHAPDLGADRHTGQPDS